MKSLRTILWAASTLFPLATLAHEGHGHENPWSPGHFLANPEHSIPLALTIVLVTVFVIRHYFVTRKQRK